MGSQPRLLDQMREVLRLKHRSVRTEKAYLGWVKRFILFHDKRHPKDMGAEEIRAFLAYLATREHVAASTQNGALNALLFLYRYVLQQPFPHLEHIERAKRPRRLPTVFARDRFSLPPDHRARWQGGSGPGHHAPPGTGRAFAAASGQGEAPLRRRSPRRIWGGVLAVRLRSSRPPGRHNLGLAVCLSCV